ncbi:hypothetical protein J7T55_008020 [Diaporthe amygdali]|uniref:uncharacterized protein n=1 Tax=Phomopsis amygdali TaxID=1214568 RepID=UPI0022FF29FD|nr:uncharacterized protein J7T55_008020 [Diaporthe amygdali]KAJ0114185.1 hypothetical protein J7T55_008020 [Diaporthe amygdali]
MTSTTKKPDLPAASGLTGLTTDLPEPGDFPELDAQTQVPVIIAISVVLVLFSATLVLLRLHTRYRVIKAAGLDDISIGVAQLLLANEVMFNVAKTVAKVSLLLQYRRIFRGTRTAAVCRWLMIFVPIWCIVTIFLVSFAFWLLTSSVSLVTDFAVVIAPIPATWALQLDKKQRTVLVVLFGVGFCTGVVAFARIFTLKTTLLNVDTSWNEAPITYLGVIEVNVAIACACVITLRPLLATWFPRVFKSSYGNMDRYCAPENNAAYFGTKKSSRDTGSHIAPSVEIYGLADLEVAQVVGITSSQEELTSPAYFEPAHFANHRATSQVSANNAVARAPSRVITGGPSPAGKVQNPHDIMVTTETTVEVETVDNGRKLRRDHQSWLTESSHGGDER